MRRPLPPNVEHPAEGGPTVGAEDFPIQDVECWVSVVIHGRTVRARSDNRLKLRCRTRRGPRSHLDAHAQGELGVDAAVDRRCRVRRRGPPGSARSATPVAAAAMWSGCACVCSSSAGRPRGSGSIGRPVPRHRRDDRSPGRAFWGWPVLAEELGGLADDLELGFQLADSSARWE